MGEGPGDGETVAGEAHGGIDEFLPGAFAVLGVSVFHAEHGAGNADGAVAEDGIFGGIPRRGVEVHVAGGGVGGALAEVDEGGAAVGEADEHEAAASDIARGGMSGGEGEGDGDSSVDGVAAGFEDGFTGVGGVGFAGDNHGVAGVDGLAGGEFGGD